MANPKIYDVKASAADNFLNLLSTDNRFFYWNDTKFQNNNIGDNVFVIDRKSGKHYTATTLWSLIEQTKAQDKGFFFTWALR